MPGLRTQEQIPLKVEHRAFEAFHPRLLEYSRTLPEAGRQLLLRDIAEMAHVDFDEFLERRMLPLMTPAEVAGRDATPVAVELHTHHHHIPQNQLAFDREFEENQQRIAEYTGEAGRRRHLSNPSDDYIPEYEQWLRDLGVIAATTCDHRVATTNSNPNFLFRLLDTGHSPEVNFRAWVSGVASLTLRGTVSAPFQPAAPPRPRNR